jgi:ubiquinone/menaquinone biosynthesis C-methylase UbiE
VSEFDQYAHSYEALLRDPLRDTFSSDHSFFHRRKWELIRDFFASRRQDTHRMDWLDVGCGQGELLELGASQFRRAAGCDPSRSMLSETSKAVGRATELSVQTRATALPFPDQSFDFVTAVCVPSCPRARSNASYSIHPASSPSPGNLLSD